MTYFSLQFIVMVYKYHVLCMRSLNIHSVKSYRKSNNEVCVDLDFLLYQCYPIANVKSKYM